MEVNTVSDVIQMINIRKIYDNGFLANDNINFSLKKGEIHAIAGENGAGKSTLMKLLYGVERPTSGQIIVNGKEVKITSPGESMKLGIGMVFQHFMLVDELTVLENIFLGAEVTKVNYLLKDKMKAQLEALCQQFNIQIDVDEKCGNLSVSQKQKVEILKVLSKKAQVLIFDEPTAVLTAPESDELFKQLRLLRDSGHTIVIITHKLQEIKALCDRVTILKKGKYIGTYVVSKMKVEDISKLMVGVDVQLFSDMSKEAITTEPILVVDDLVVDDKNKSSKPVSFDIRAGEIVCITGVEGSGQEKLIEYIAGIKKKTQGKILLGSKDITKCSIKDRRAHGLSYIPADRMVLGADLSASVFENMMAHQINKTPLKQLGFVNKPKLIKLSKTLKRAYSVKTPDLNQQISLLSGGNIQKVVTAREIEEQPQLLVAEHPTRGVDVGTMELIFNKMRDLKKGQKAILLVSTDWNEMMALADRIIIFYNNEITAIIDDPHQIDEYELGYYMLGLKKMEMEKTHEPAL